MSDSKQEVAQELSYQLAQALHDNCTRYVEQLIEAQVPEDKMAVYLFSGILSAVSHCIRAALEATGSEANEHFMKIFHELLTEPEGE